MSVPNAREKLSRSAAALFQRFGYARVSIREITSSVDIPKGAFYNHFKSKEALASAILSQHFNALLETLTEGGGETAGARFRRHFESLVPSTEEAGASPLLLISTWRPRVRHFPLLWYSRSPKEYGTGAIRLRL